MDGGGNVPRTHGEYRSPMGLLDGWRHLSALLRASRSARAQGHVRGVRLRGLGEPGPGRAGARRARRARPARPPARRPGAGLWDIPGGFVEEPEHPLDALRRELREETGLEIEPTEFFGIWMQPYDDRNVMSLTWLATPAGGEERAGDDLVELRWFAPGELPGPDELAFESYVPILSLWRARHEHA